MKPFRIDVPHAVLTDLRQRLERTRYPVASPGEPWSTGVPPEFLSSLVNFWLDDYNWRAEEERLNSYPQFVADVDGLSIHFVHLRATDPNAPAVIITHGWPYTFAEMLPLVDALRGRVHLVVPSLPGYGFSAVGNDPVVDSSMARRWNELMCDVLEYDRYVTYGEDVGAGVSDWLAALHPDRVVGIVAPHPAFPPLSRRDGLTEPEVAFFAWLDGIWSGESGYSEQQSTRPDTLAASVGDSPAGLVAWIVEKFHAWADLPPLDGEPGGAGVGDDLIAVFDLTTIITTAMIYWVTDSIGTSFRPYLDGARNKELLPMVKVPAAIAIQQHEREYPRAVAERTYTDIRSFEMLDSGGHFTAYEAPEAMARIVLELLESIRSSARPAESSPPPWDPGT
jgi:epoxide hydrolase